jgi:hypothetical protein
LKKIAFLWIQTEKNFFVAGRTKLWLPKVANPKMLRFNFSKTQFAPKTQNRAPLVSPVNWGLKKSQHQSVKVLAVALCSTFSTKKNDQYQNFADLVSKDLPANASMSDVLNAVWANETIRSQCPDLVIRLTSLRGQVNHLHFLILQVSKRILEQRGYNPNSVQILAVGTVAIPQHLPNYHHFLDKFYERTEKHGKEHRKIGKYSEVV